MVDSADRSGFISRQIGRRLPTEERAEYWRRAASLADLPIRSQRDLAAMLPALPREQMLSAMDLAAALRWRVVGVAIAELFATTTDPDTLYFAGDALRDIAGARVQRILLRVVRTHSDDGVRKLAAHKLATMFDRRLLGALIGLLNDASLPSGVRGEAAEGIGSLFVYADRRTAVHRRTWPALVRMLGDPSPEVRFWCCFALGQMRATRAIAALQHLADTDNAICPNWWHVRDEAADAIADIEGRDHPDRVQIRTT